VRWRSLQQWIPVVILAGVATVLYLVSPERGARVVTSSWTYLLEILAIMPAVVLLMGLFEAWVPSTLVEQYMGRGTGAVGSLLAFVLGTLPTGPLYVAFPVASGLLQKGASTANVVVFLGAWAAAKIPQVMVEARFLGASFAAVRLLLTLAASVLVGYTMQVAGVGSEARKREAEAR